MINEAQIITALRVAQWVVYMFITTKLQLGGDGLEHRKIFISRELASFERQRL